jgi:hypothetical protein
VEEAQGSLSDQCPQWVESGHGLLAKARIQLRKSPFEHRDIFRARGLELAYVFFVDMRDCPGLDPS